MWSRTERREASPEGPALSRDRAARPFGPDENTGHPPRLDEPGSARDADQRPRVTRRTKLRCSARASAAGNAGGCAPVVGSPSPRLHRTSTSCPATASCLQALRPELVRGMRSAGRARSRAQSVFGRESASGPPCSSDGLAAPRHLNGRACLPARSRQCRDAVPGAADQCDAANVRRIHPRPARRPAGSGRIE